MMGTPAGLVSLLMVSVFLAAAASPSADCPADGDPARTLRAPLDPGGFMVATPQTYEGGTECGSPLPSVPASATLRNDAGDPLHGLPAPDILRPIDEPRRAPQYQ